MILPPDQVLWMHDEITKLISKCFEKRIHPTVFLYELQMAAETAYTDKLPNTSQEEWDAIVRQAKDEVRLAKKVIKEEISFEDSVKEMNRLRDR